MSDQELLAYIDRKFGGQEAEPDHIPDRGPDPHYAAALAQEAAFDDEDLEEEPSEDLASFADRATDAWAARPDEDEDDEPPEASGQSATDEAFGAWWASLDTAGQDRIRQGTAGDAVAEFNAWASLNAPGDEDQDQADSELEGPVIQSGRDVVEYAYANRELLRSWGHTPESWLSWASSAPPDEWRKAALEAGWDPALRPGYMDLTPKAQMSRVADDLARSAQRTKDRGGYW